MTEAQRGERNAGAQQRAPGALSGLKVLDASGWGGQYCGKMFSDLGAEVVLVEPTGGSAVRRDGPFLDNKPHIERSLPFAYFNAGKRSIALDLDRPEGQDIFRRLAVGSDLLIESEKPGVMAARGLDFASLSAIAPQLVMTSITPFGQTGPFAQYEAEDIVALALGGLLYLGGYPETEPIAVYGNQAYLAAAQFAAVASMIALHGGAGTNQVAGRHIDLSVQECVVLAMENAVQFFDLEGTVRKRNAGHQRQAGMGVFPCADGQVYFMAGGIASNRFWDGSVQWLIDEGVAGAEKLKGAEWKQVAYLVTDEAKALFAEIFTPFCRSRTKAQLYAEGQARRLPICPINTPRDLLDNRQLAYRDYFTSLEHPWSGRSVTVPGSPYQFSETPWRLQGPAPRLGEHTSEILSELQIDPEQQAVLLKAGVIQ
jgi:benzylsuccinate CoA-transferase BbsE subunit